MACEQDNEVQPLRLWQTLRWLGLCAAIAATFGWPVPQMLS